MEHPSEPASQEVKFDGAIYQGFPPLPYPPVVDSSGVGRSGAELVDQVALPYTARFTADSEEKISRSKLATLFRALLPVLSLAVSVVAYAWIFNWQLSVGIIVLLFIHEIGHYLVIRAKGLPASLPIFIPMVGAYVEMRRMPASVRDEAEIAIAGPALGALSGIACYLLFQWTQQPSLLLLAQLAFLLNLINLIPVAPLDGGRIVGAISRWIWLIGLILIAAGFFYIDDPVVRLVLLILGWLGFVQLRSRFSGAGLGASYYRISLALRGYIALLYLGLATSLVLGLFATEQTLNSMRALHFMMFHLIH